MKKTALLALTALVVSSNVFAASNFRCIGTEVTNDKNPESIDTILVITAEEVKFQDISGDDQTLERSISTNEERNTYSTYGNYEYDGYGGFIQLRVPKNARSSTKFVAYYQMDTYSELGKVGELRIKLNCSATR